MDIKRAPTNTISGIIAKSIGQIGANKTMFASVIVLLASVLVWPFGESSALVSVDKSKIWTGTVQSGTINISVDGYGKLQSKVQWLLNAPAKATVKQILLKPGAQVSVDSVVLQLQNTELAQQVTNQQMAVKSAQANLRQQRGSLRREYLAQQGLLAELEAQYGTAKLKLTSMTQLAKQGIVSQLDFKSAQLQEVQLNKRLGIENERLEQLAQVHKESLQIQQEQIDQQKSLLEAVLNKQQSLTVRAGIGGVLQQLPVELGQSVDEGQKLALVGSTSQLLAQIFVAQTQVEQIVIGQTVDINTRGGMASGKVSRIDPVVKDGSVLVEVALSGQLPDNARPELTVDATIHIGNIDSAIYIKRPVNAQAGSSMTMFQVNADGTEAHAINVTFGAQSDDVIQILSGALPGYQLILSDTNRWQDQQALALN
jgi:HlyD family secretion protein